MKWSHVGLNCRDIDRTERFYTALFGFQRARCVPLGDGRIVFLRNQDAYLELFAADGGGAAGGGAADGGGADVGGDGPRQAGLVRHLAFQVDDVDAFLAGARGSVEVTLGPLDFDAVIPGWRTVWIADPDGVIVEVSQGYADAAATGAPDG